MKLNKDHACISQVSKEVTMGSGYGILYCVVLLEFYHSHCIDIIPYHKYFFYICLTVLHTPTTYSSAVFLQY